MPTLRVLGEITDRGCDAAGYRLAGADLDHVCCRRLYSSDRMPTVWRADDCAVVVLVGPHSRKAGDVYDQLLNALGADIPADEREKAPAVTTMACRPSTRRQQKRSPTLSSGARGAPAAGADLSASATADFCRNSYRTGCNQVDAPRTAQPGDRRTVGHRGRGHEGDVSLDA
ncbi:MAG TPA: hypothetical protein VFA94_08680 [Acidimicrobiales bacterium]|nr:hypothetical protein [Acidimicrobiales bacterium]